MALSDIGIEVYLIHQKDSSFYKVGVSSVPEARIDSLQTGNPEKLEICGRISCRDNLEAHIIESLLHSRLSAYKKSGEWFEIPNDIIEHLLWMMSPMNKKLDRDGDHKRQRLARIYDYFEKNPGATKLSTRKIAKEVGVSHTYVAKVKKQLLRSSVNYG